MTRAGDVIIIALCAIAVGAGFALTWRGATQAAWAEVRTPDGPPIRIALEGDRRLAVRGRVGESVLRVDDGRVRFVASPCRGRQCVHSGWLDRAGDFAACLPNGVSLTLVAADERYDALAY